MLGHSLRDNISQIMDIWYKHWENSDHPHPEIQEAALRDSLPLQLQVISDQLRDLKSAELTKKMWKVTDRLDPEARVSQEILIEEVVQEYRLLISALREWIEQEGLQVSFEEYSYLFDSIFELTAEAVRRYSKFHAERVTQERGEYLACLAHEMRSPLAVISSQLDLAETESRDLDKESFVRIRRNANRLIYLINGVMRLERFKSEDLPVRPKDLYLADLLDQIIDDHQFDARAKKLCLQVDVDRSLQVTTDPDLFIETIGNLVQNAIKYTDKGFVKIQVKAHDGSILFKIQDSGAGISEKRKKEMFKITQPEAGGGAGLGLSIVHRAVTALDGSVEVESRIGEGSTFCVTLPRKVQAKNFPDSDND